MKSASDLVGDLLDDLPIDGRGAARLKLGLKRAQQRLDRTEINRRRDCIQSRAELVEDRLQPARADLSVSEAVELVADLDEYRLEGLHIRVAAAGRAELGVEIAQKPFDRTGVDRCGRARLEGFADAVNAARQFVKRSRIDRRGSVRASDFLIEPRRDLLQALLDRDERRRGRGAFDLPTGFGKKLGHLGGFEVRSGTRAEPLDAIGQFADLPLQPFERRRAQRGRGEEIAHFLRLPPDGFKRLRVLIAVAARLSILPPIARISRSSPGGRRLRIMRLQRRAEFGGHRLERSEHRFAVTALTQHLHPLHEVADGALERDHRVARRKIGEAPAHGVDLGAHGAEVDGGGALIGSLAAHVIKLERQGSNVVEQQLRERRRSAGARRRRASHPSRLRRLSTGVQLAGIALGRGRRGRAGVSGDRSGIRRRRAGPAATAAGLELVAAHGDLRHRGLEIEWRLRVQRGRGREAVAMRLAGLSDVGQVCPDRFEPPHRVDQRAAVAVPRRVVPLQNLGDSFKGASGLRFGAREPHFKALDQGIERVRNSRRARRLRWRRFVARSAPGAPRPHQADRRPLRCAPAARADPVQRSRRSLRQANRQGACRRGGRPRRRRRGSAGPTPAIFHAMALFMSSTIARGPRIAG